MGAKPMPLFIYMDVNFCNFKKSPKSTKQIYIGPRVFNFTPTQEGTGDPAPNNIRPILPGFSLLMDDNTTLYVWGGSLNIVSGEITLTWDDFYFDGSSSVSAIGQSSGKYYTTLTRSLNGINSSASVPHIKSDKFLGKLGVLEGQCYITYNGTYIVAVLPQTITTTQQATEWFQANPTRFIYELATPQVIQLSTSELQRACEQLSVPYPLPPVADNYTTYNCTLHENTDIINPVIKLKTDTADDILQWNYCYIPTFSRYYFVDKVEWNLGTWLIYLNEDTLASNKTAIGASTQYVVRSASQFDGSIIDSKYTTKTGVQYSSFGAIGNKTLFGTSTDPWYIVGIIGGVININAELRPIVYNGSVVYYAMRKTQFAVLMAILLDTANFDIPNSEISNELQKQLINPLQYIHSIRLVPFQPEVAATARYVNLGFNTFEIPREAEIYICKMYDVTDVAHVGNGCVFENQVSIMAECHPDYTNKGEWVQSSPYTKYVLSAQPFGRFEIPSGIVTAGVIRTVDDKKYIQVDIDVLFDATTGMCTMKASVDGGGVFLYETRDMTVPVPYHQTVQDYMSYRQANRDLQNLQYNAVRGFLSSIMDFDVGEAMNVGEATKQKSMSAIDSATEANQVTVSGNGTQGSVYSFHNTLCSPTIEAYFTLFADEYNTKLGRPLCKPKQINTLAGYIQCQNAAYSSASLADENRQIVAYMNGGFFYE